MAAVLNGSTQLMLTAATDAVALSQPFTLTATVQAYGGPSSGTVVFMDGSTIVGKAAVTGDTAQVSIAVTTAGMHLFVAVYQGADGTTVRTTPIAVTAGKTTPPISIWNQKHTVVGGRSRACGQAISASGPDQPGCEAVFSNWLPGAVVTYTLSYADGTNQTFTLRADGKGHAHRVFAVRYQPPPHSRHGQLATKGWISVVATSKYGSQAQSFCLRFAILPTR